MFFLILPPSLHAVPILYANQATVQYLIGKPISCSAAPIVAYLTSVPNKLAYMKLFTLS